MFCYNDSKQVLIVLQTISCKEGDFLVSSISAASVDWNMAKTQQAVGVAMVKKVMDQQEIEANAIIQQMQQITPSSGHQLDIMA